MSALLSIGVSKRAVRQLRPPSTETSSRSYPVFQQEAEAQYLPKYAEALGPGMEAASAFLGPIAFSIRAALEVIGFDPHLYAVQDKKGVWFLFEYSNRAKKEEVLIELTHHWEKGEDGVRKAITHKVKHVFIKPYYKLVYIKINFIIDLKITDLLYSFQS